MELQAITTEAVSAVRGNVLGAGPDPTRGIGNFLGGGGGHLPTYCEVQEYPACAKKNITQVAVVMRAFAISNSSLLLQRSRSTLLSSTVVVSERPAWAASYMSESLTNVQSAGAGLQQQDQEHGRTVTRTPVA